MAVRVPMPVDVAVPVPMAEAAAAATADYSGTCQCTWLINEFIFPALVVSVRLVDLGKLR